MGHLLLRKRSPPELVAPIGSSKSAARWSGLILLFPKYLYSGIRDGWKTAPMRVSR
jgi:hypothetical protein